MSIKTVETLLVFLLLFLLKCSGLDELIVDGPVGLKPEEVWILKQCLLLLFVG